MAYNFITEEQKAVIKAKNGRKKVIKSVSPTLAPDSAERELLRVYNAYGRLISQAVRSRIPKMKKYYKSNIKEDVRHDGFGDIFIKVGLDIYNMGEEVKKKANKLKLADRLTKVAKQTQRHSANEWSRVTKDTLGEDIFKELYDEQFYYDFVNNWVRKGLRDIENIQQDYFVKLEKKILEAYRNGDNVTKLFRDIQKDLDKIRTGNGMSARDAVGNLNAELIKAQCEKAGVTSYIWNATNDDRVRECHKLLNGRQFRFDNPPEMWYRTSRGIVYTGKRCNPGEDYCCRCTATPIFDLRNIK